MATAQLSRRDRLLHCRGELGAFDARAVQSALQNLLTRILPTSLHTRRGLPISTLRADSKPTLAPSLTYGRSLLTETAFLREISEGTSN